MESSTLPLPADLRWRRLIGVVLFLGLLWAFRHLAVVFVCSVLIARALGATADFVDRKTPLGPKSSIAAVLLIALGAIGAGVYVAVQKLLPLIHKARHEGRDWLEHLAEHPSVQSFQRATGLEGGRVLEKAKEHASEAVHYATATAHVAMYLLIGLILGIIYLFERKEIDEWLHGLRPMSVAGTLVRWFGYVGDAITITVRMQAIVALVNAIVTLPVLVVLGLPRIEVLFVLILVSGLLPVVGNAIAGAVLCFVAYTAKGPIGVVVFLVVTFVLHKIESYYLNPRLAAQHVHLPGLVLVVSLLLFEHTFGFVGLFLSFPALYVATRIHNEWKAADAGSAMVPPVAAGQVVAGGNAKAEPREESPSSAGQGAG